MRTEVKVGLLICVVAVVVVASYLMIFSGDEDAAPATDPTVIAEPAPEPAPALAPERAVLPRPSLSRGGPIALPELTETVAQSQPAPRPAPASANRPVPVTAIELPTVPEVTERLAGRSTPSLATATAPARLRLDPAASAVSRTRTYVVREGDNGFWTIARKAEVYGAGKYHYLIAQANPKADSNHLQVGQKLVIPPLPVAVRRGRLTSTAARSLPGSAMQYTVAQGDTCWTLAQRFLGDAGRYQQIVRANPGIDADNLTVGQKITIPGRTAGTTVLGPSEVSVAGTTYTIAANDTLSSIAKARYGSEALWRAIAKANDLKNPDRLKVGAIITLPSAAEARRLAGVRDADSGAATARAASSGGYVPGKPWFGQ